MMATPAVMSAGGEQDSVESSSLMLVADAGMCRFAFDVLHAQLEGRAPGSPPESIPDTDSCAVFVTWKKQSKDGKKLNLRGCIGTLTPISLHEGLVTYTISAAFRDRRFQPISLAEVEELEVSISLLTNFERTRKGVYDWNIGQHGLIIDFRVSGRSYSATYLPEVCAEQRWTKAECIESLMRKAGYNGYISEEILDGVKVTRYESTKFSMHYKDYRRMM